MGSRIVVENGAIAGETCELDEDRQLDGDPSNEPPPPQQLGIFRGTVRGGDRW